MKEKTSLTVEQRRILKELDRIADFGAKPKQTYLNKTNYKHFTSIMRKKQKSHALDDIDLVGDVYRGVKIVPISELYK